MLALRQPVRPARDAVPACASKGDAGNQRLPQPGIVSNNQKPAMTTEIRYTITERWLEGDHGPMRYWESEPQHGLPVLLIHGYGALIEHWRRIMRPIARAHTLYALDLYGFGYSAQPAVHPSKEMWADQVADLICKVLPAPAVVVGHSMGGMVAAQFTRDYPELVRALALVDSTGLAEPATLSNPLDQAFFTLARAPGIGETLAGALGNAWGVRQGLRSAYYRKELVTPELIATFSGPLRHAGNASGYLAVTRAFERFFLEIKPGEITVPALLIWGKEDRSVPPSLATYFKQQMLPHAEISIITESGHCPFDETPQEFCDVLLPWLARLQHEHNR